MEKEEWLCQEGERQEKKFRGHALLEKQQTHLCGVRYLRSRACRRKLGRLGRERQLSAR